MQLKHSLLKPLTFIIILQVVRAIYKDPPRYFNSFYCNLGTKTIAESGDYTCTSPRVIERADKFSLALVEYNKESSADIWFTAEITSLPGVSLSSVLIRLNFKTSYITKYGYMVLVIGYQPQNIWLDVINVKLPINTVQNQVILSSGPTFNFIDYEILFASWLGIADRVRAFITSYGIKPITPTTEVYLKLSSIMKQSTSIVPSKGSNSVDCGTQVTLYDHGGQSGNYANNVDGYTVLKNQGSSIITLTGSISTESGYDYVYVYKGVGIGGALLWMNSGSKSLGPITSLPGQSLTIRFFSDYIIIGSGFQIQVSYSGTWSTSSTIRLEVFKQQSLMTMFYGVMVWKSSAVPSSVLLLLKSDLDLSVNTIITSKKINLYTGYQKFGPSFNTKCFLMLKSSKYSTDLIFQLSNSTLNNFYQAYAGSSTGSAQNLFDFFCLVDSLTTVLGEFDYVDELNGQYYSLGNQCPVPTIAFSFAQNLCQKCAPMHCINCEPLDRTHCTLCDTGYTISSTWTCFTCGTGLLVYLGQCKTCSQIFANCNLCNYNLSCATCATGFWIYNGECKTCLQIIPNCNSCISNSSCGTCASGFQVNNGQCKTCSQILPNCNSCNSNSSCGTCATQFWIYGGQCKTCSQIIPNCNSCFSNTSCQICVDGLFQHDGRCYECGYLIKNCITCQNSSTCLECAETYKIDSNKKCNLCQSPLYMVSDLCSPDRFCISAYKDSANKVVCTLCDFTKNYYIDSNKKCVCGKGYQDINSVCTQICGDGIIQNAECDDNNVLDGDGCSSECKIQPEFTCAKTRSGVSKCKLNRNVMLKLEYVDKVMSQNKALMYFSLDSNNPNVQRFYQSNLFNLTLSSNRSKTITILNFQKNSKGQIVIQIQYNQTIQDTGINLNFGFPKQHVISQDHHLKFILKGNNFALIISGMYEKYHQVTQIQIYFIAISYAIVLIFLFSDKFIAVQALSSLQMVYFSLLLIYKNSSWTQALSTVLPLKYSMGFNQLMYEQTNFANLHDPTFNKFRYLRMCEAFLMNNFTNSSILIVFFFIFLILFFFKNRMQNNLLRQEDAKEKKKIQKSLRRFRLIFRKFHNLTFNFSYVMIFEVIVSLYIESAYMKSISLELKMLSKFTAMWSFSIIIFTVLDKFKHIFFTREQKKVEAFRVGIIEQKYKAIYLCYLLVNAIVICLFNNKIFFSVPPSAFLEGLAVFYFIFLIFYRPYQYSFGVNGFTVIVNQLIVILTLALITAMNYGIKFEEFLLLYFCYILLGFCASIVLLTFVRIYLDYRYGAVRVIQEMRKQIEQIRQRQEKQFFQLPSKIQQQNNNLQEKKHKRNNYIYQNVVKKQEKINFLNQLKGKSFLMEQQRDCIYYKFYKQKPLDWVQKHQKKAKYLHLLQKEEEDLQKDVYNQELQRKKQQKMQNSAEKDELKILKNNMRKQYEKKSMEKERLRNEKKARKREQKGLETNRYDAL